MVSRLNALLIDDSRGRLLSSNVYRYDSPYVSFNRICSRHGSTILCRMMLLRTTRKKRCLHTSNYPQSTNMIAYPKGESLCAEQQGHVMTA
jgi:hypothetical protein